MKVNKDETQYRKKCHFFQSIGFYLNADSFQEISQNFPFFLSTGQNNPRADV